MFYWSGLCNSTLHLGSWSSRFLSFAGRFNLISSIIWSTCNFWLSAFRLPRACIQEIEKLCSSFLWSGTNLNSKKAKISWNQVCKPKTEGGLGLRSLKEANDVCCLKLVWRIISHGDSLWVKWVEHNLLKREIFWTVKENANLESWIWKKILKYRGVAKRFCKAEVGNGESTSFWFDDWSLLGRLIDVAGIRGTIDMGISRTMSDRVLWKGKNDIYKDKFSTKDTWNYLRTTSNEVAWHKGVWFPHATPKYSFCLWLAAHDRLATGARMIKWNRGETGDCTFCRQGIETRDHLFFSCSYTSEVWTALAKGVFNTNHSNNWSQIITYATQHKRCRIESFLTKYILQATAYTIWRERNRRRHGDTPNTAG
ncbi:putative reverse transcriptase zinc-binding domain-containing protein [Arabidopsis thaliana]